MIEKEGRVVAVGAKAAADENRDAVRRVEKRMVEKNPFEWLIFFYAHNR